MFLPLECLITIGFEHVPPRKIRVALPIVQEICFPRKATDLILPREMWIRHQFQSKPTQHSRVRYNLPVAQSEAIDSSLHLQNGNKE